MNHRDSSRGCKPGHSLESLRTRVLNGLFTPTLSGFFFSLGMGKIACYFLKNFIGVALQFCVSFCCTESHIYVCVYIYPLFFEFPSQLGHQKVWVEVPVLYRRFSLVIYFIGSFSISCLLVPSCYLTVFHQLLSYLTSIFLHQLVRSDDYLLTHC